MQLSIWKNIGINLLQLGCYVGGTLALSSLIKGLAVVPILISNRSSGSEQNSMKSKHEEAAQRGVYISYKKNF